MSLGDNIFRVPPTLATKLHNTCHITGLPQDSGDFELVKTLGKLSMRLGTNGRSSHFISNELCPRLSEIGFAPDITPLIDVVNCVDFIRKQFHYKIDSFEIFRFLTCSHDEKVEGGQLIEDDDGNALALVDVFSKIKDDTITTVGQFKEKYLHSGTYDISLLWWSLAMGCYFGKTPVKVSINNRAYVTGPTSSARRSAFAYVPPLWSLNSSIKDSPIYFIHPSSSPFIDTGYFLGSHWDFKVLDLKSYSTVRYINNRGIIPVITADFKDTDGSEIGSGFQLSDPSKPRYIDKKVVYDKSLGRNVYVMKLALNNEADIDTAVASSFAGYPVCYGSIVHSAYGTSPCVMREAVKDKEGKVEKKGEFTTFYHAHHNEVARLLGVDRVPDPPLHSTFAFNCYSGLMVGQSGDHRIIFGEKWFNYDLFISDLCRGVKQFSCVRYIIYMSYTIRFLFHHPCQFQ